jgi:hypothetical protein
LILFERYFDLLKPKALSARVSMWCKTTNSKFAAFVIFETENGAKWTWKWKWKPEWSINNS